MFRRIALTIAVVVGLGVLALMGYMVVQKDAENLSLQFEASNAYTEATITARHSQDLEATITALLANIETAKGDAAKQRELISALNEAQAELRSKNNNLVQENSAIKGTATVEAQRPTPTARIVTRTQYQEVYIEVPSYGKAELWRYNPATTPEDCGTGCVSAEVSKDEYGYINYDSLNVFLEAETIVDGGPFTTYILATMNSDGSVRWANVPQDAILYIIHPLTGYRIPVEAVTYVEVHGEEINATNGDITDEGGFKTKPGYEPIIVIAAW